MAQEATKIVAGNEIRLPKFVTAPDAPVQNVQNQQVIKA